MNDNDDALRAALAAERAGVAELRRVAQEQREALDALRKRPAVRAALAIERRTARVRAWVRRRSSSSRRGGARFLLAVAALPRRPGSRARRARLERRLRDLPGPPADPRSIVILVTGGRDEGYPDSARTYCATRPGPSVAAAGVVIGPDDNAGAILARSVDGSSGDLVCVIAASTEAFDGSWLDRLAQQVKGDVAAACPQLVHPRRPASSATPHDLRVRSLGYEVTIDAQGAPVLHARAAGADVDFGDPVDVDATAGACLVVDRRAYVDVGGFRPLPDLDAAVVELCLRLRAAGKRIVAVPSAVLTDARPVRDRNSLTHAFPAGSDAWRAVVDRQGPAMVRLGSHRDPAPALRFTFTVASPSEKVAARWGDWHLARALASALERRGHRVDVHSLAHADDLAIRAADVHVVVRGITRVRRSPGQRHILWVISHPESVSAEECDEADLVVVASKRFAAELRTRTSTPVDVLLQATDPERFRPVPAQPQHAHRVAVVAKTRDILRPAVRDALAAGLRPAIYGSGWERFVDPALVVSDHVPNEDLAAVYSSIGVLLNDHWDTMREWGFVSNRLFDALACEAVVVSDDLPEIRAMFGASITTYRDPAELRRVVDSILDDPAAARERARAGRRLVLDAHTFDHRATELVGLMVRYGIIDRTAP